MRGLARLALVVGLGVALIGPAATAQETRRMEALGAAGIDPEQETRDTPRDRARIAAVQDAVRRVALELVPEALRPVPEPEPEFEDPLDLGDLEGAEVEDPAEDAVPESPHAWLDAVLGTDPFVYATRFRVLEDRGVRPALLTPGFEMEYVVVMEVFLDEGRVRDRLAARGLLPEEVAEEHRVLEIELEVDSYAAYASLREILLSARGVHRAMATEMARGRVILAVETELDAEPLLTALIRRTPPELRVELLGVGDDHARMRVALAPLRANEDLEDLP